MKDLIIKAKSFVDNLSDISIDSEEIMSSTVDSMKILKNFQKAIKEDKETITKPLNEALKNVRAKYKLTEDMLDASVKLLKSKQDEYLIEKLKREKKRQAKEKKCFEDSMINMAEAFESSGMNEEAESIVDQVSEAKQKRTVANSVGGFASASLRRSISFEVENINQVPFDLLQINAKAVHGLIVEIKSELFAMAERDGLKGQKANDFVFDNLAEDCIPGIKLKVEYSSSVR